MDGPSALSSHRAAAANGRPAARRAGRRTGSRGAVAVEYGLLLPALLLFVLGIIDVGRLFWTYTTLYRAAEAAARCGAVDNITCGTATQIQNYAVDQAYGLTIEASTFTATPAACGVRVTASLPFTFIIPWVVVGSSSAITLDAIACYPI